MTYPTFRSAVRLAAMAWISAPLWAADALQGPPASAVRPPAGSGIPASPGTPPGKTVAPAAATPVNPAAQEAAAAKTATEDQRRSTVESLARLSLAAEAGGDLPGAIAATLKLSQIETGKVEHLLRLGSLYQRAGMADKRVDVFRGLRTLQPDNQSHALALATALYRLGQKDEAHALWNSLLAGEKVPASTFLSVGTAYRVEDLYEQALAVFEEGLERHPKEYQLTYGKAQALEMLGRTEEAIAVYEESRLLTKRPSEVDGKLSRLYMVAGASSQALQRKRDEAKAALAQLAERTRVLGDKLAALGQTAEARTAYTEALAVAESEDLRTALQAAIAALDKGGKQP